MFVFYPWFTIRVNNNIRSEINEVIFLLKILIAFLKNTLATFEFDQLISRKNVKYLFL